MACARAQLREEQPAALGAGTHHIFRHLQPPLGLRRGIDRCCSSSLAVRNASPSGCRPPAAPPWPRAPSQPHPQALPARDTMASLSRCSL